MIDKYTNCFDSPFLIFIKGVNHLSDKQVLQLLGFDNSTTGDTNEDKEYTLYLTRSKEWIHIMDNWSYHLWRSTPFENRVDKLGEKYDVFYCSVGDCDNSFDFTYFQDRKLRRKYVFEDSIFTRVRKVAHNIGEPLPFEEQSLQKSDEQEIVISIAKSIGIEINHKLEDIVCYEYLNSTNI